MSTTIFAKMKIFKMFINGWGLKFLRLYSRKVFFLLPTKERTKENCRCCDAAGPRLGGCTPPRPPKRKSQGPPATRTQYYCSRLTPTGLAPLLSRGLRGCEPGATVERSETGVANNVCPCGASNRTSGPALLAGGARCVPPSAPNPRCGNGMSVGAGLCSARAVGGGLPPSLVPLAFPLRLRRAACPHAAALCL